MFFLNICSGTYIHITNWQVQFTNDIRTSYKTFRKINQIKCSKLINLNDIRTSYRTFCKINERKDNKSLNLNDIRTSYRMIRKINKIKKKITKYT